VNLDIENKIYGHDYDSVVLYRLPFKKESHILLGFAESVINGISEHHLSKDGFVFEPFEANLNQGIFINSAFTGSFETLSAVQKQDLGNLIPQFENMDKVRETSFEEYAKNYQQMLKTINEGELDKVILSRIKTGPKISNIQAINVFEQLASNYSHAFVYVIFSSKIGLWIGAGPELLLRYDGKRLNTVSLAGTIPNTSTSKWTAKELDEQSIVTEYIENVLLNHQVEDIIISDPQTISAGQIKHLCSYFSFTCPKINGNHIGILYDLHPTPAVCGMPKEDAYQLIMKTEQHDREFYAGFLGPVVNNTYEFYVNLRCLKTTKNGTALFVGGGLTKDSDLKKEWQETELKSQTLLSVLKNI